MLVFVCVCLRTRSHRLLFQNLVKLKDTTESLKAIERDVNERLGSLEKDTCQYVDAATASVCVCRAMVLLLPVYVVQFSCQLTSTQ